MAAVFAEAVAMVDVFFGTADDLRRAPDDVITVDQSSPYDVAIKQAREDMLLRSVTRSDRRLGGESLDDLLAEPDEPVPWLIRGLLVKDAVGIIGAEAKGTKTWIGCEIMTALSSGTPVFGRFEVSSCAWSLGCFLEDSRRNVKSRFAALKRGRGAGGCDTSRIRIEARPKIDLKNPDDRAWIIASARAMPKPPALIYIDPLRNAHTADENSSTEMQAIMDGIARIRDVTGAVVITPHHMARPSKDKVGMRLAHRLRGSTAIFGAADAAILVETKKYARTNDSAEWLNLVDVEVRDVTPAPMFGVGLHIQLADGRATVAGWAHYEDPKAMTEAEDERQSTADRILRLLQAELQGDRNCGRAPRAWSAPYIGEQIGISRATAQRHLDVLTKAGAIIRIGRQWRAIDEVDEDED
jgi:hypothetical protein